MVKLLFFCFRVTNSRLKSKKVYFEFLPRCMCFSFLTSSYEREVDKWKTFYRYYSFKMTWNACFYYVFLYLACFVVITYVMFIWVCWILMAYAISTKYLFTRLQETLSSCEPKKEWPHAALYNYNGRQIEPFHTKWFNCG